MQRNVFGVTVSAVVAAALSQIAIAAPPLLTPDQQAAQAQALALAGDGSMQAARAAAIKRYQSAPSAQLPDGRSTLNDSVNELVYGTLLAIGNDAASPKVIWNQALPYDIGAAHIAGGRYGGDDPDRIYRSIAVDPAHQYEIHGKRLGPAASLDFSFEAIPGPALWGKAKAALQAQDVDVAADGSFVITADATPANERRNHLQLPPGTTDILIRDTLDNWTVELPNELTVRRVDAGTVPPPQSAATRATPELQQSVNESLKFIAGVWKNPPNHLFPVVRKLSDGVRGGVIAVNRFRLKDDEALLVTLDPLGGRYLGFEVTDPWARSADYARRSTSLNNAQARPDPDGAVTYVLSSKDPGIQNWLDTGGLHDGLLLVRWELLPGPAELSKAVRTVRVVKLSQLASALPAGLARVTPDQRAQWLSERTAAFERRLAQK